MPDDLTARERILAAAERLFAERGFDHTSTALVAAEARVPQGLIFYHFKTKMELLASDESRFITAHEIAPDAGVTEF